MPRPEEEPVILEAPDGKEYDRRIGWEFFEMLHRYGARQGWRLTHRYYFAASWAFHWVKGGLDRQIQIIINEESFDKAFVRLTIMPGAWFDDEQNGIRYADRKPLRGYLLFLPVTEETLYETLDLARNDALGIKREDLPEAGPLSPTS